MSRETKESKSSNLDLDESSKSSNHASSGAAAAPSAMSMSLDAPGNQDDRKLELVTKDSKRIPMIVRDLKLSTVIMTAIEHDHEAADLPLTIAFPVLSKVCSYLEYHKGVPAKEIDAPLRSVNMRDVVGDKWDAGFIDDIWSRRKQDLYEVILAANYLDIHPLLHLGCAKVASLVKGKPIDAIKTILRAEEGGASASVGSAERRKVESLVSDYSKS